MRRLLYILQKEFIQIFRNKAMLPIIFMAPVLQLVVLTFAANFELKHIRFIYTDNDKTTESQRLVNRIAASPHFDLVKGVNDFEEGMSILDKGDASLFIRIPNGFTKDLTKEKKASISIEVNSIDGQAASLSYAYAQAIINNFNTDIIREWNGLPDRVEANISVLPRYWFNEEMEYKNLMVPGILAVLITMVGMFLSSMNIVREKEIGTIEQLNVTPILKAQFLIGKLFPFWVIALIELTIGLIAGRLIFDIPINGSLLVLYSFVGVYLVAVLGIGLWISTVTNTQQQAMFISWFFIVIFLLMSGLFTPVENMPQWAQKITLINPIMYIVRVIRSVLLKGSGFTEIAMEFQVMVVFAIVVNIFAVLSYRKRSK